MAVDTAAKMKRIGDNNDQVIESVKTMSLQLERLDPRTFEQTSRVVRNWAQNVRALKASLEEQQVLSREMRETARIQDERQSESARDKQRFLVEQLKSEIRGLFSALGEFIDLQKDMGHCLYDMETHLKHLTAISAGDSSVLNVDPLVALLNYRDRGVSLLLGGVLYQIAVLHWDLKSDRAYADGPMVQMAETVVNVFSKTESVPAKYRLVPPDALPGALDSGPFSLESRPRPPGGGAHQPQQSQSMQSSQHKGSSGIVSTTLTPMQARLLTVFREMRLLDEGLRSLRASVQIQRPDKAKGGQVAALAELQAELAKWYNKCTRLEQELSNRKERNRTELELEVEKLQADFDERDMQNKQKITELHKLESDMQGWKYELANLRREKAELADQNAKMTKESKPVLDKMDRLLCRSREAVDRLSRDAEWLSKGFQTQVAENKRTLSDSADKQVELETALSELAQEKEEIHQKEVRLQKKEILYLRTMAARKAIHDTYMANKANLGQTEEKMQQLEADCQEMQHILEGRENEIKDLQHDLQRAHRRIEELNQQQAMCMESFTAKTGQPGELLLGGAPPRQKKTFGSRTAASEESERKYKKKT